MRALLVMIACLTAANGHSKTLIVAPGILDPTETAVIESLRTALAEHPHAVHSGWLLDPSAEAERQKSDLWMQIWFERAQGHRAVWARIQRVGGPAGWVVRLDDISDPKATGEALAEHVRPKPTGVDDAGSGGAGKAATQRSLVPRQAYQPRTGGLSVNINTAGVLAFDWYALTVGQLLAGYNYVGAEVSMQLRDAEEKRAKGTNFIFQAQYRLHVRGQQDSFFLYIAPTFINTQGTVQESTPNGRLIQIEVDHQEFVTFAGIGARWFWDVGFNITARVGVPVTGFDTTESREATVMGGVESFDGELSMGWVF